MTHRWTEQVATLAWGAWSELGVSGWAHTHGSWAVDPEPLIFLTAGLGDSDPRLRDEATDWCILNWRFVSKVRLRNLHRHLTDPLLERYGEFAATVNEHAGVSWPGARDSRSRFRTTGRSRPAPLGEPALICLRTRAIFGVSARAEILRHLLAQPAGGLTLARLADLTGFAKRNVAEECEMLERAGLLTHRTDGNRFVFGLARREDLETFVGALPAVFPNWTALAQVVLGLVGLAEAEANVSPEAFAVEVHATLRNLRPALEELTVTGPARTPKGGALWPEVKAWGDELLTTAASGRWPGSGSLA